MRGLGTRSPHNSPLPTKNNGPGGEDRLRHNQRTGLSSQGQQYGGGGPTHLTVISGREFEQIPTKRDAKGMDVMLTGKPAASAGLLNRIHVYIHDNGGTA